VDIGVAQVVTREKFRLSSSRRLREEFPSIQTVLGDMDKFAKYVQCVSLMFLHESPAPALASCSSLIACKLSRSLSHGAVTGSPAHDSSPPDTQNHSSESCRCLLLWAPGLKLFVGGVCRHSCSIVGLSACLCHVAYQRSR